MNYELRTIANTNEMAKIPYKDEKLYGNAFGHSIDYTNERIHWFNVWYPSY